MKVTWDYTDLAQAYLKRPEYAQEAIDQMVETAGLRSQAHICDVGAGAAHLTLMLARKGFEICAVEPNDAMRANGIEKTKDFPAVQWFEGVGEATGMPDKAFELVTFGSSFNVCDRARALQETARLLKDNGWFACMWNHRDLHDPLQKAIEETIQAHVPDYQYGTRREDQTAVIDASGLFGAVVRISGRVLHEIPAQDFIDGWKSHGTLQRQSKELFELVNAKIADIVQAQRQNVITVPYTTNIWMAQKQ